MTTGSGELDSLIDGIQEGLFYSFYGDIFPLDALSHRLLVNCAYQLRNTDSILWPCVSITQIIMAQGK